MPGWVKLVLVVLSLGVLYWPAITHHREMVNDPYFAPYDAVQYIPPFFKFETNDPIPTTYVKEYYLNTLSPLLYKASLIFGAQFGDVRRFQLGMMYLAYGVFLLVMGRLGWLLGGAPLSFAVVAFTTTAWIFFGLGFTGGAPRMYGYPLISLVLYSLIRDRPCLLAITVILSGLLYPIAAIIGGLCLASWLLFRPLSCTGLVSRWSLSRRLATVALTGFLTIAGLFPLILGSAPYGRRVVEADIAIYPEAGPDGNYRPYDQLPYKLFGSEWTVYFVGPLYSHGDPVVPSLNLHGNLDSLSLLFVMAMTGLIVLIVIFCGIKLVLKEGRGSGVRLCSFFAVCGLLHFFAWLASPYLYIPTRYLMLSLPFLVTLIFPWSLYVLLQRVPRLQSSCKLHGIAFLTLACVYLTAFGGRGNVEFAEAAVEKSARPLFDAISALPKDAIIAGWPVGHLRKVEYVTRRNAFLTGNVHQVLHVTFLETMRKRMDALFEAYFSIDAAPLHRLRREFGVTHLIIDTRDFTDPKQMPEYFSPWRARIKPRLAEIKGQELLMNGSLHKKAAIVNQNGFLLLDLSKLP